MLRLLCCGGDAEGDSYAKGEGLWKRQQVGLYSSPDAFQTVFAKRTALTRAAAAINSSAALMQLDAFPAGCGPDMRTEIRF